MSKKDTGKLANLENDVQGEKTLRSYGLDLR